MSIYDECMYCNQDITGAQKDTLSDVDEYVAHNTCVAEADRRESNKLCIICGGEYEDIEITNGCHEGCFKHQNYSGYPGA